MEERIDTTESADAGPSPVPCACDSTAREVMVGVTIFVLSGVALAAIAWAFKPLRPFV